ncbi:alpha/beta fold hydrolase [Leifsonia aquatica]|uniref:alpha/beta fold hydrolase n=1 Tax=Leifsonia aquatica TaxID=144185 RepID=UPI000469F788|nr:alpha/beta fold hydrolase [Leifsonia aquatica]
MQQRIARVVTDGGAEVAYATVGPGTGRAIVYVAGWLGHLERAWELPEERAFFEGLARGTRVVRYDRAGCGMSPPASPPAAPSLASELDQLDAVVATLGPEPFDLVGVSMGATVAAAWTAAHPGAVRRLVLYGGWVSGMAVASPGVREHLLGLVTAHWGLGSDVLTDVFAPDAGTALRAAIGRYQRASSSAAMARSLLALSYDLDIGGLLDAVRAPTLVVHREHDRAAPLAQGRALAAGIPGARLLVLPGRSHLPFVGDAAALVAAIRRFLGLRAARAAAGALTARQHEVAVLVGAGLTNRQIAARLGIEERSAEGHVERIRQRLGFRSRAQIAAWQAEQSER